MERKEFLKRCATLTAGIACIDVLLAGCASLPYVDYEMDGTHAVVNKADFEDKGFVLLEIATLPAPVYVRQVDEATYTALLLRCTHRGCTVQPAATILECPCHGSRYNASGEVIKGPAPRDLRSYPVTADAERVQVALR